MKHDHYRLTPNDRILFIRLSAIGDVVNAVPGFVALRRSFPRNFIAWCVEEPAAELLRGHPMIDELLVVKREWRRHPLRYAAEIRRFVRHMRELRFTVAIDAHGLLKSSLLAWLSGAPVRIGQNIANIEYHQVFLNTIVGPPERDWGPGPAAVRRAHFLRYLGVDLAPLEYVLPSLEEEKQRVAEILAQAGIAENDLTIVLNPCASRLNKQWPGEYFIGLGRLLIERLGARLIWTGARQEAPYIAGLVEALGHPSLNLAGRLNLRELAALLGMTKILVTGDTGPMHIGAAMGTYVVALMGSTDPRWHGPFTERKLVLTADEGCRYCGRRQCDIKVKCLKNLGFEEVFERIKDITKHLKQSLLID